MERSLYIGNDLICDAYTFYPVLLTEQETAGIHRFSQEIYYQFDCGGSFSYSPFNTAFLFEAVFDLNQLNIPLLMFLGNLSKTNFI